MSKARRYRLQAVEYAQQSLLVAAHQRPMLNLLAQSWLQLADQEEARAKLGEARSFEPRA